MDATLPNDFSSVVVADSDGNTEILRYFKNKYTKTRTNNNEQKYKNRKKYFSDEIGKQDEKVVAESETKIDVTKMYLVSRIVRNCTIETHQKGKKESLELGFTASRRASAFNL